MLKINHLNLKITFETLLMRDLQNNVVVVTGASSGIGKACALAFASKGCKLVLAARRENKLAEVAKLLPKSTEVLLIKTDVADEKQCENLINEAINSFGKIDILINNAGISMRALFNEVDLNVIRQLMDVNFWGAIYCTRFAMDTLLKSSGCVVGVSSIAGFKGLPGRVGYSASKFALHGFLEALRIENLKTKLHVMLVAPGFTASEIRSKALNASGDSQGKTPRNEGKMMSAEMVANYIVKGVERNKRQVILTSQGKMTVLLNKLFPSLMDKIVYNHMAKEPNAPFK